MTSTEIGMLVQLLILITEIKYSMLKSSEAKEAADWEKDGTILQENVISRKVISWNSGLILSSILVL